MLTLSQLEEALDDCLNFINLLTGKIYNKKNLKK